MASRVGQYEIDTIVNDPFSLPTDRSENTTLSIDHLNNNCVYHQNCMNEQLCFNSELCLSYEHVFDI